MHIRLIATDLDGTLLNEAQEISEGNRQALLDAQKAGIHTALVTGRIYPSAVEFARQISGLVPVISCNGALITVNGRHIGRSNMAWPLIEACSQIGRRYDVPFHVFTHDTIYNIRDSAFLDGYLRMNLGLPQEKQIHMIYYDDPQVLRQADAAGVLKVVYTSEDTRVLSQIRQELAEVGGLEVTSSWYNNLEIMPEGVHKGIALMRLAEWLGVGQAQVMAIGDSENDLAMLRAAAYPVAMGNAVPAVKGMAVYETLDNRQDGVAYAIRQYALGREKPSASESR